MPRAVCPLLIIALRLLSTHLSLLTFRIKFNGLAVVLNVIDKSLRFVDTWTICLTTILGQWTLYTIAPIGLAVTARASSFPCSVLTADRIFFF